MIHNRPFSCNHVNRNKNDPLKKIESTKVGGGGGRKDH